MPSVDLKKVFRDRYTATRTPSFVDVPRRPFLMSEVIPAVTRTKDLAADTKARMEHYAERTAGQILHIGPYADEAHRRLRSSART